MGDTPKEIARWMREEAKKIQKELTQAQNKAVRAAYDAGAKMLTYAYGMKKGTQRRRAGTSTQDPTFGSLAYLKKLKNNSSNCSAQLLASTQRVSAKHSIVGPVEPAPKKGIVKSKRKRPVVKVRRKRKKLAHGFILKLKKQGKSLLLERKGKKAERKTWPSVHEVLTRPENLKKLKKVVLDELDKNLK